MNNVFKIKYKVMKDKIQKFINIIKFCYIEKEKGEQEALLNVMQMINTKYDQSFEKIMNSKNINKSLKYKQLESIVIQGINKLELQMIKKISQNGDLIRENILSKYRNLKEIEDIDKRIEEIENVKEICLYFNGYMDDKELKDSYFESKFEALLEKVKINILEQKENFNIFKEIEDKEELKTYEEYLKRRIMFQTEQGSYIELKQEKKSREEKIKNEINYIVKYEKRKYKIPALKKKKSILLDDELLIQYIMLNTKQSYIDYENKEKRKGGFTIGDINTYGRLDEQFFKERKNDAKYRLLYAYLTQMKEDREYSIEDIEKIFKRFELSDYFDEIIKKLINSHEYEYLLEELENREKSIMVQCECFLRSIKEKDKIQIKTPRRITQRLVELEITPNDDYVGWPKIETVGKFVIEDTSNINPIKQKERICKELKRLNIWNKFIKIDEEYRCFIIVNLDDFEGMPIDESKLEIINDKNLQKEYIEMRIGNLENLIEYCIPDTASYQKNTFKTQLKEIIESLREMFYGIDYLEVSQEKLDNINELNKKVIEYIENNIMKKGIDRFIRQKLQQIDSNMSFEDSIEKLKKMNVIKLIKNGNVSIYEKEYTRKKFEVLCRRILQEDIRCLENPNVEEILKSKIFPYCTEKEREEFERELRKIVEYVIINKKDYIPIEIIDARSLEELNVEEILKSKIFPYCTEKEREEFEREFRKKIKSFIVRDKGDIYNEQYNSLQFVRNRVIKEVMQSKAVDNEISNKIKEER